MLSCPTNHEVFSFSRPKDLESARLEPMAWMFCARASKWWLALVARGWLCQETPQNGGFPLPQKGTPQKRQSHWGNLKCHKQHDSFFGTFKQNQLLRAPPKGQTMEPNKVSLPERSFKLWGAMRICSVTTAICGGTLTSLPILAQLGECLNGKDIPLVSSICVFVPGEKCVIMSSGEIDSLENQRKIKETLANGRLPCRTRLNK